jgi:Leucine-rich repeat (LRR) protein
VSQHRTDGHSACNGTDGATSGFALTQLSAHAFRRLGLLHLQRILLQRRSIRSVERSTFMGLTNLVELDLNHNNLATIPIHAFDSIPQLGELKLSGNPLVRLNNHALAAVSQLVRLQLRVLECKKKKCLIASISGCMAWGLQLRL